MGALPTQTWCISTSGTPLPRQKYSAQTGRKKKRKKKRVFHGMTTGKYSWPHGSNANLWWLHKCKEETSVLEEWLCTTLPILSSYEEWSLLSSIPGLLMHSVHSIKCSLCSGWKCSAIVYLFVGPCVESIPNSLALVPLSHTKISSKRKTRQAIPAQMQTCACIKYCRGEALLKKVFLKYVCTPPPSLLMYLIAVTYVLGSHFPDWLIMNRTFFICGVSTYGNLIHHP